MKSTPKQNHRRRRLREKRRKTKFRENNEMQSPQWFFIILHLICIIFFFFFPFLYHPALFTYTRWDHIRKLLRTSFSIYLQFLFYFLQNNYVSDTVSSHFSSVFFVCVWIGYVKKCHPKQMKHLALQTNA